MSQDTVVDPDVLSILQESFPDVTSYELRNNVVQLNSEGCLLKTNTGKLLYLKRVFAKNYERAWPDLRKTLLYIRTEARFYKETLPALESKGLLSLAPKCFQATYDLTGLISEEDRAVDVSNETPENLHVLRKSRGGYIVLEAVDGDLYFQDSPLTPAQATQCLVAAAKLHAAAWQENDVTAAAAARLSRGSYNLELRNPKELAGMEESWENFSANFSNYAPDFFAKPGIQNLGKRMAAVAKAVSRELSPAPTDPYATLVHGDYKAMNLFLPVAAATSGDDDNNTPNALMIDFASTGVGLGMSDVAMHIFHALLPKDIDETSMLTSYLTALESYRKLYKTNDQTYPRHLAERHYRLAVIDYARFFLGRFWKSATLESMAEKRDIKNVALINRDPDAAIFFISRVHEYLTIYENECSKK